MRSANRGWNQGSLLIVDVSWSERGRKRQIRERIAEPSGSFHQGRVLNGIHAALAAWREYNAAIILSMEIAHGSAVAERTGRSFYPLLYADAATPGQHV